MHKSRLFRVWSSGEWCWFWRSRAHLHRRTKASRQFKEGAFLGPAHVLLQERERKGDYIKYKAVVWIVDGDQLVRCSSAHLRPVSSAEQTLCSLRDGEARTFQQVVQELPKRNFVDLVGQPSPFEEDFEEPMNVASSDDELHEDFLSGEELASAPDDSEVPRVGRLIWLPGSSGELCSDGVQECFDRHEKRHTNIHGGQGSGLSSKSCKRLLPCGRCGFFRWFSNDNAERITTDWRWERYEHWHEQPDRERTWSWTRKRKPRRDSRRPSPAKSRVTLTGAAKGGPTHGLAFNQVSVCSVTKWDIWPGIVQIAGRVTTSGINLKRAFGSFVVMTGDKGVSSLVLTTTPQQEVEQGSDFTMSHVPVAIWLCLLVFVEQFLFHWCHRPALSSAKHGCSVGTQTEPKSIPPPSPTQQRTPRTVLITENGMKSTKVFHSSTVCNTSNRSAKVTLFRQCTQCPSPSVAVFAEWAAFAVKNVKGYALLDTGASRSVGGYMMVQYVIDCLSRNTAPPWLESADPAASFTFAGGEKAHSETPDLVAASRYEA